LKSDTHTFYDIPVLPKCDYRFKTVYTILAFFQLGSETFLRKEVTAFSNVKPIGVAYALSIVGILYEYLSSLSFLQVFCNGSEEIDNTIVI